MRARKKPIIVDVVQADRDGTVYTLEGAMTYEAGDYIVTGPLLEKYPVKRHIFEATYDVLDGDTEGRGGTG